MDSVHFILLLLSVNMFMSQAARFVRKKCQTDGFGKLTTDDIAALFTHVYRVWCGVVWCGVVRVFV